VSPAGLNPIPTFELLGRAIPGLLSLPGFVW